MKHIEKMQRQQVVTSTTPPATSETEVVNKFRAGFTQCTGEVSRFPGLDTSMKKRLLSHLDTCLRTLDPNVSSAELSPLQPIIQPAQLQVHILQNSVNYPLLSFFLLLFFFLNHDLVIIFSDATHYFLIDAPHRWT